MLATFEQLFSTRAPAHLAGLGWMICRGDGDPPSAPSFFLGHWGGRGSRQKCSWTVCTTVAQAAINRLTAGPGFGESVPSLGVPGAFGTGGRPPRARRFRSDRVAEFGARLVKVTCCTDDYHAWIFLHVNGNALQRVPVMVSAVETLSYDRVAGSQCSTHGECPTPRARVVLSNDWGRSQL